MLRRFVLTCVLFAPVPALACGMYVPDQKRVLLADLIEQIDEKVEDVKAEIKPAPEVDADANVSNDEADAPEAVPSA